MNYYKFKIREWTLFSKSPLKLRKICLSKLPLSFLKGWWLVDVYIIKSRSLIWQMTIITAISDIKCLFYIWAKWGPKSLSVFPKVTRFINDKAGISILTEFDLAAHARFACHFPDPIHSFIDSSPHISCELPQDRNAVLLTFASPVSNTVSGTE